MLIGDPCRIYRLLACDIYYFRDETFDCEAAAREGIFRCDSKSANDTAILLASLEIYEFKSSTIGNGEPINDGALQPPHPIFI